MYIKCVHARACKANGRLPKVRTARAVIRRHPLPTIVVPESCAFCRGKTARTQHFHPRFGTVEPTRKNRAQNRASGWRGNDTRIHAYVLSFIVLFLLLLLARGASCECVRGSGALRTNPNVGRQKKMHLRCAAADGHRCARSGFSVARSSLWSFVVYRANVANCAVRVRVRASVRVCTAGRACVREL